MAFRVCQGDITKIRADAIVNAANTGLRQGSGVCGAIFRAAGPKKLQAACDAIGGCPVGEAVLTEGFDLPARYVVHTVGPVWRGGGCGEEAQLRRCYQNALCLAAEKGCASIAFPLISSGIFGYPKREALRVAREEIEGFLAGGDMAVTLMLFDGETAALAAEMGLL